MKLIPAPLNYSENEFIDLFKSLSEYFKAFQIDIQDGRYITNKTIGLTQYLEALQKSDQAKVKSSTFDFHLQTVSFAQEIRLLSTVKHTINIDNILVHYSLEPNINKLKKQYPFFSIGIVLNPEDKIEEMMSKYDLKHLDAIQIMSIHPGPQGTSFIPETLNKIDQLRQQNYRNKIFLDGAINQDTLPIILNQKNRPDVLCIGSFLTKAGDKLPERVTYLKETIG